MMKDEISNVAQLAQSLSEASSKLVNGLRHLEASAVELEQKLEQRKVEVQGQLDEWDARIAAKRQDHVNVENSIKSLKAQLAELVKKLEVGPKAA